MKNWCKSEVKESQAKKKNSECNGVHDQQSPTSKELVIVTHELLKCCLQQSEAGGFPEIGSKTENQEKPSTGGKLSFLMHGKCEGLLIRGLNEIHT